MAALFLFSGKLSMDSCLCVLCVFCANSFSGFSYRGGRFASALVNSVTKNSITARASSRRASTGHPLSAARAIHSAIWLRNLSRIL